MTKRKKKRIITRWLTYTILVSAPSKIHDKLMKVMTQQMQLGCVVDGHPATIKGHPATAYTITNPEYDDGT